YDLLGSDYLGRSRYRLDRANEPQRGFPGRFRERAFLDERKLAQQRFIDDKRPTCARYLTRLKVENTGVANSDASDLGKMFEPHPLLFSPAVIHDLAQLRVADASAATAIPVEDVTFSNAFP